MKRGALLVAALVLAVTTNAEAQRRDANSGQSREQLQRQFQARLDSIVKDRLQLTDEQFGLVREIATRIEQERRTLRMEDGRLRMELRRELNAQSINEDKVADLLERIPRIERRRHDLNLREQRELAKVLRPSQRARYVALQEEMRRNMQEMMRKRLDASRDHDNSGRRPPQDR